MKEILIIISLCLVILTSFKKDVYDVDQSVSNEINTTFLKESRMSFKNVNQLEQAYAEYKNNPNLFKNKLLASGLKKNKTHDFPISKLAYSNESGDYDLLQEIITDEILIEDDFVQSIINEQRELEVSADVVYKIIPYGTFFTPNQNYKELNKIIDKYSVNNLSLESTVNYTIYNKPVANEEDLYNVAPGNPWEVLTSVLKPYKPEVFKGSLDWDPTVRANPLKYEINLLDNGVTLDLRGGFQQSKKLIFDQAKRYHKNIPHNVPSTVAVWLNSQPSQTVVIAGPNGIKAYNQASITMPIDSYTDAIFSITGGKINWLKDGGNSFHASKDASKIILEYASIYGVARIDNTGKGAIIENRIL